MTPSFPEIEIEIDKIPMVHEGLGNLSPCRLFDL
jgi:hypothetical protein